MNERDMLRERARALRLWGVLAHWEEVGHEAWVERLVSWEENEQRRRSLEYRSSKAKLGRFKPLVDFDWSWPRRIDRELVEELFTLAFVREAANVVLVGPNGVGKTQLAQNLAAEALLRGYRVRFTTAAGLLGDLDRCESASALERTLASYASPHVLVVDEVGYLSFGERHADLLFQLLTRRYERYPTVLTTNRPFGEWGEVFPNATCVVTLVDRLLHRAEVVKIEGDSYRAKEAEERAQRRRRRDPPPDPELPPRGS